MNSPINSLGIVKGANLFVCKDQTCGVPGRFIGESVAYLWDDEDPDWLQLRLQALWLSCLSIKKRPLAEWIRASCWPPWTWKWTLAPRLSMGSIFCLPTFLALSKSMVCLLSSFRFLVVSVQVYLCRPGSMCWFLKSCGSTVPIHVSLVFPFLVSHRFSHQPCSMWMALLLSSVLMITSLFASKLTLFMRRVL